VRRSLFVLAVGTLSLVRLVTLDVHPAAAIKEDCQEKRDTCVWDMPDFHGKMTVVPGKCMNTKVESAAHYFNNPDKKLHVWKGTDCTGPEADGSPVEKLEAKNISGLSAVVM
jgi:hypothetical protein